MRLSRKSVKSDQYRCSGMTSEATGRNGKSRNPQTNTRAGSPRRTNLLDDRVETV